ncbi:hypothetical protein [Sinomonas sp. P47F7]|uniref:hypothetical protein n=1 Tax=Sinomonas sp. P47F7 TaxID=3410987 RepID=UPI003BF533E6
MNPAPFDATRGRQLLLDDHLIADSTLTRVWVAPTPHPANPILRPETERDLNGGRCPVAAPFDDGIHRDPETGQWRVWYMSGWFDGTVTRTSPDGIDWHSAPPQELTGLTETRNGHLLQRDGVSIVHDPRAEDGARFRMLRWVRERTDAFVPDELPRHGTPVVTEGGELLHSADGIHWTYDRPAGPCGDNTTFFHDPFRDQWVFSLRTHLGPYGRGRGWHAGRTFAEASAWTDNGDVVPWVGSLGFDSGTTVGDLPAPEIYKVTCIPYESAMLGVFAVYRGPSNDYAEAHGTPKVIDLYLGISRDGYHYTVAPEPLLASTRTEGAWDAAYLHMVNGGILPVGDETRLYYTGFSGQSPLLGTHMYAGASMGVATLRRDGFCALTPGPDGQGSMTTRPLTVSGDCLYLNVDTGHGWLRVIVTDPDSGQHQRFSLAPGTDGTRIALRLAADDGARSPRAVELQFSLSNDARLYSFWISDH